VNVIGHDDIPADGPAMALSGTVPFVDQDRGSAW
jgi:hypothetical protein